MKQPAGETGGNDNNNGYENDNDNDDDDDNDDDNDNVDDDDNDDADDLDEKIEDVSCECEQVAGVAESFPFSQSVPHGVSLQNKQVKFIHIPYGSFTHILCKFGECGLIY